MMVLLMYSSESTCQPLILQLLIDHVSLKVDACRISLFPSLPLQETAAGGTAAVAKLE